MAAQSTSGADHNQAEDAHPDPASPSEGVASEDDGTAGAVDLRASRDHAHRQARQYRRSLCVRTPQDAHAERHTLSANPTLDAVQIGERR